MATESDRSETRTPDATGATSSRPGRRYLAAGRNFVTSSAFWSRRRRDRRFRIVPFDALEVANWAALAVTAGLLLAIMLDPHLYAWQKTLPAGLVGFFRILTDLGRSHWILISTGIYFLTCLLLDASTLPARTRMRRAVRATAAGYVFLAVAASGIIANLIKLLVGRARPKLFEDAGSYAFNWFAGDSDWASFPSGHATTAMAFGVALALLFPRLRWAFLSLGFWIAFSRMVVRAHYPSDVLAGCLLGGLTAWLLARALAQRRFVFGFDAEGRLHRRSGLSGRLM